VAKLNTLPSRLVQADADAVFAAGWDEAGLFHAIQVCAAFNPSTGLWRARGWTSITAEPRTA
jgi:hypothetical protein